MTEVSDPESVIERAIRALDRLSRDFKRRTVWFAVAIVVLVLASIVMGVTAYRNANSAQAARREANRAAVSLAEYKADNTRARVFACHKANEQIVRDRDAFVDTATVLVAQLKNPTPEQAATIARYIAAQRKKAVEDFPFRSCTPAGIAQYFGQTS